MLQTGTIIDQEKEIRSKISTLNNQGYAVIFAITGGNGAGKTHLAKHVLTNLPFHQSFNLGLVTKTLRCLTDTNSVSMLENFHDASTDAIFSRVISFSCAEYQKNGVNVLIDGVQVDPSIMRNDSNILGGVILEVSEPVKLYRNDKPTTHFKRKLELGSATDIRSYRENEQFKVIVNDGTFAQTYEQTLAWLGRLLDKKIRQV